MKLIDKAIEEETKKLRNDIPKRHCPSHFNYLGIDDMFTTDSRGTCKGTLKYGKEACNKCWNREYKGCE